MNLNLFPLHYASALGLLISLASSSYAAPLPNWKIEPFSSTDKLLVSGKDPAQLDRFTPIPIQLDAVRGEVVSFQFVVRASAQPIQTLAITPNGLASIEGNFVGSTAIQIFRENYVRVQKPSGNRIREPKWWPDALVPLELAPQSVPEGGCAVFWATIRIPRDQEPGDYFGELDVAANGDNHRLALTLHVRRLQLPESHFRGTVALYYDVLRDWYRKSGHEFSDEEWQPQKQRYADFLLGFGLNPYDPPFAWNDARVDGYLKDARVHSVRTPPLDSPDFSVAVEAFKRTDTLSKAFYYWNDEPQNVVQFAAIRHNGPQLRALGIPQLVTVHPNSALNGAVDIWCPNVGNALGMGHLDLAALRSEQWQGRPTWLYTMVVPKNPYPTWLLDDDSSAILSYAPLWAKVGATGFVYSMVHGWGPKPLEDLTSYANTNGDGTLLYPAELVGGQGPMPSIRLMLLRDALEDYGLWQEARMRKIAPAFEFPAFRKEALVYNRTALLNILETGKVKPTQPSKGFQLFPEVPSSFTLGPSLIGFGGLGEGRAVVINLKGGVLSAEFHGKLLRENDAVGIMVEPVAIDKITEQWRLYWSNKGLEIQKRTAQGRFEATLSAVRAVKTPSGVRFWIPLAALNLAHDAVRFNALWLEESGTTRLFTDAGDPFLAPILKQSVVKAGQREPKTPDAARNTSKTP
ncbi:hypothetical protein IAD21_03228 [Abditibacteriota bacterium]|nr:hypothetical protein IAD21_03228 [Abditibacteriota bacterium]